MTGYGEVYYGVHEAGVNYPLGVGSGAYRVSIQKKAYVGSATALLIAAHSQILKQEPEKKQKFFKYCSTSLSFEFVEQEALSLQEFYTEDDREWCLEYTKDGNLIYRGWIFGQNIKERYTNAEYTFEITATDGLKELDKIPFVDTDGFPFTSKLTGLEVLKHINRLLGLDLPMSTVLSVYEVSQTQTDTDDVLAVLKIDQQRFLDENGAARTCKYVLSNLCILLSANFFQNDGILCFERYTAEAEGKTKRINYDKDGTYLSNTSLVATYEVSKDTSHAAIFPTVEVDIEPALEEVTVDYSYKAGSFLFGNFTFEKTIDVGTNTTTEVVLSATDNYKYIDETGFDFEGYTVFGGASVKKRKLNEEASAALYAIIGKTVIGSSFQNPNTQYPFVLKQAQNNYIHLTKGTGDSGVRTDKAFVVKDSIIDLIVGINFWKPSIDSIADWSLVVESETGQKQYLRFATGQKFWSPTLQKNNPLEEALTEYTTIPRMGLCVNFKQNIGIAVPITGYIYAELRTNNNATSSVFQHLEVRVNSAASLVETESHTANNIKKYTKIADKEELSFSDEAMGYLPSTLWKGDRIAGSFVKKAVFLPYKLIDLAVETVFQQYHRPSMVVYLDYLGVKLNIGQRATFGSSVFPKLAGRTWKITDNRSYCFETMMGSCTMHEVFTDFAEYDRNNQVLDKDGKTIHIVSDRITGTTSNTITPWTWTNIGGATGSAARIPFFNTYLLTTGGNDIWGNSDSMNYLWRTGGLVSVEGTFKWPTGVTSPFAKQGIMYRESIAADSRNFSILMRHDGYLVAQSREADGATTNVELNVVGLNITKLKLENTGGNTIKVYYHNGNEWVLFFSKPMNFTSSALIGFCFAMAGQTVLVSLSDVIYSSSNDNTILKPNNLIGKFVQTKAEETETGIVNKPLNLTGKYVQIKSAGSPVNVPTPTPTTGWQVLSFHQKAGLTYIQTGFTGAMKLVANIGAGTVTDEYWGYQPIVRDANNNIVTVYTMWKMDSGKWHKPVSIGGDGVQLVNYAIPANLKGLPLTFTKYFITNAAPDFERPQKWPLQQQIIVNAT